ncbi:hypothetical protein T4B_12391 [Trichinella pseudospiralis]|uniref:Uncharacterized protein n=2 Tax=Trichinella pseudospiralis TaxID=6337 RepID=A0A0V1IBE7_TRIPS|nr:hypothetical protein T4A_1047 [Trichinella pseudospiralis]KRY89205.1 hypothetical protein T4D_2730 [Trichinella pseudospiralis]KRZ20173.1 hypothetical protein T4B_12391 [Trichinella pseudospiralis]
MSNIDHRVFSEFSRNSKSSPKAKTVACKLDIIVAEFTATQTTSKQTLTQSFTMIRQQQRIK